MQPCKTTRSLPAAHVILHSIVMVHFCCVPSCSNNSIRDSHLSFFRLPLKDKACLKKWVHVIGRQNLPVNPNTRVVQTSVEDDDESTVEQLQKEITELKSKLEGVTVQLEKKELQIKSECLRLSHIKDDKKLVSFYTSFQTYEILEACYTFLGPAVDELSYNGKVNTTKRCRSRALPSLEEFFLTLVRLRLGLMEEDLAHRFGISQSTVSRIILTWINFLFLKFKEIPLWPPKVLVQANMPDQFKKMYPSTRVILDATEIFIDQPRVIELQQVTFSNYKNHNTFKGLIGISPDGVVTFISSLFSGSISDKELTRRSGIYDLLEPGDSVMADRGFDIEDSLLLHGVSLNIPPFMRGKKQLPEKDLVTTRRIASLRIHVEHEMERIKNFHIFDRSLPVQLTDIADRIFFVCCILTNFQPPLC